MSELDQTPLWKRTLLREEERTYAKFFWSRGVLSLCSGVVTITFWLHTGVEVREGFSSSSVSCLVQKFKNCTAQGRKIEDTQSEASHHKPIFFLNMRETLKQEQCS